MNTEESPILKGESPKPAGFLNSAEYTQFSKMFSGLETMGGLWDSNNDDLVKLTLEPRETKAAAANLQWLAFQEEASLDEMSPVKNLYLDAHSKTWFDGQAGEDISFYDRMRREFNNQNQWNFAVSDVPQYMVGSLIDGQGDLTGMSRWRERYGKVLRPDQEAAVLRAATGFREQHQPFLQAHAPLIRRMYGTMAGFSGKEGSASASGADVAALGRDISRLPEEEQDELFGMASLYARHLGMESKEQKSFFNQFGESIVRGTTVTGNAMIDKGEEGRLFDELSLLQRIERGDFVPADISLYMQNETNRRGRIGNKELGFWTAEMNGAGSAELRAQRMQEIQNALGSVATSRRLRQYGSGEVDPIKPIASGMLGAVEGGLYSVGRALPVMALTAVPVVGPGGAALAYSANEYERIRHSYPDMPISQARTMADISGGAQAALGVLQIKTVFGGLPATGKLLEAFKQPGRDYLKRVGVAAGLNVAEQYGQETLQNATPLVVDALANALGADMPGYDWKKQLEDFGDMQPETVFGLLPLLLVGAGAISLREAGRGRQFRLEAPALTKIGLSAEEARAIANERNPDAQGRKFQEAWKNLPTETKRAAVLAMDAETRAAKAKRDAGHAPNLAVETPADAPAEWVVRDDEGNEIYRTPDQIAAGAALEAGLKAGVRFSKTVKATPAEIGRAVMELAKDEDTRILGPTPTAKDLPTIMRELSPDAADQVDVLELKAINGSTDGFRFTEPDGGFIDLKHWVEDEYYINSENAGDQGTPINQAVYTWAHNNGYKIIEDPAGLLEVGVLRRASHMYSAALRAGTTRHMEPGTDSGIEGWRSDDSSEAMEHNVGLLAMREAELVKERLSEVVDVRYDKASQSFYDGEYRIPADKVQAYLQRRIAEVDPKFSRAIGHATLRRALATLASREAVDGSNLVGKDAKAPPSLRKIRYSKDAGGDSGVSESGRGAPGEESGGVSGEAGRGGSSPELRAARTEQVRAWVKSVRKGWKSKLDVVIHDSAEAIPNDALRSEILAEGGSVEAFFNPSDKKIHLLADRIDSKADAERLLRHEGIHWVLDGPMRKEYQAILKGIQKLISKEEWESLSKSYADAPDHVRVEEYLAYLGQTNPKSTVWQSFVYEVKQFLRSTLGKEFEVTDGDVLAFLNKANRRLESSSKGHAVFSTHADLVFAKGSDRKSWDEVQVGDDFNAVKRHLPRNDDPPQMFDVRGTPSEVYARVASELKKRPTAIDPDGLKVLVANPERNDPDLLLRGEHLAASKEDRYKQGDRRLQFDKARWIANIWKTIEDYGAKIRHYNDTGYVRKYRDGTIHLVFVEDGKVVGQQFFDAAIVSQRSLDATKGLKGATILRKR